MKFRKGNCRVGLTNPTRLVMVFETCNLNREKSIDLVTDISSVQDLIFNKVVSLLIVTKMKVYCMLQNSKENLSFLS